MRASSRMLIANPHPNAFAGSADLALAADLWLT
jgi:hypothetical protein